MAWLRATASQKADVKIILSTNVRYYLMTPCLTAIKVNALPNKHRFLRLYYIYRSDKLLTWIALVYSHGLSME